MGKRAHHECAEAAEDDHPTVKAVFNEFKDLWDLPEFKKQLKSLGPDELKELKKFILRGGHSCRKVNDFVQFFNSFRELEVLHARVSAARDFARAQFQDSLNETFQTSRGYFDRSKLCQTIEDIITPPSAIEFVAAGASHSIFGGFASPFGSSHLTVPIAASAVLPSGSVFNFGFAAVSPFGGGASASSDGVASSSSGVNVQMACAQELLAAADAISSDSEL
jgi:hypothetical protein